MTFKYYWKTSDLQAQARCELVGLIFMKMCDKSLSIVSQWMCLTPAFCFWEVPAWNYGFSAPWHQIFTDTLFSKLSRNLKTFCKICYKRSENLCFCVIEELKIFHAKDPQNNLYWAAMYGPPSENNSSRNAPKSKTFSKVNLPSLFATPLPLDLPFTVAMPITSIAPPGVHNLAWWRPVPRKALFLVGHCFSTRYEMECNVILCFYVSSRLILCPRIGWMGSSVDMCYDGGSPISGAET